MVGGRRMVLVVAVVAAVVGRAAPANASDDTFFPRQWNLAQVGAPTAWAASTGVGVTIGVVDTGVDADHPDLAGKIDGFADCTGGSCRAMVGSDPNGHGTIVSGIAAAATDNGRGLAGMAPDARLVVAKVLTPEGEGDVADINAGIRWVVDRGARVVNLSLGDPNFLLTSLLGTPLQPGIDYAWSHGAVPVVAAGNYNVGVLELGSSNYGNVNAVVVGATDRRDTVASYSSSLGNAKWGVAAPGGAAAAEEDELIISTYPGGRYSATAGTSMAAPHVSGALALLMSQGLSGEAAVKRLIDTVDRVPCGLGCQGRIDVASAVGAGAAQPVPPPTSEEPPAPTPAEEPIPVVTAAPPATSTTVPPTTSTTVPPTTVAVPAPTTPRDGGTPARALDAGESEDGSGWKAPLAAGAAVLFLGVSAGLGTVVRRRFRDAEVW